MENELRQKRIAAYRTASQSVKDRYGDLALGEILERISVSQSLSPERHRDFVNLIGDYILGFYPQNVIEARLVSEIGVSNNAIPGIMSEIVGYLSGTQSTPSIPLPPVPSVTPPQIPEAPKDLREKLELRPEGILSQTVTASERGVRPLTREEVLRSLAPARTMAGDIASLGTKQNPPSTQP